MACPTCQRRSALIAAIAPAISRLTFTRRQLLGILSRPNAQLLRAAKVENPEVLLRGLRPPLPTDRVPTALCRHDVDYPEALRQLPSAPAVLYATCTTERLRDLLAAPTVAILGTRTPTDYARRISSELARDLACAGVTVISGMSTGLEGIVHRGALQASGNNIAVMAGGANLPFPSECSNLHRETLARGAAVSELPPSFRPQPWSFIASQRIVAALARLIVIVEVGEHSCALLASQIGSDLGADVGVVPGRVTDPGGLWIYRLLRDGAHPVSCAQDVVDLLYGVGAREIAA